MNRGDVVLVDFLFSDRTGSKLRPALVVQADFLNALIQDSVLVAITRTGRPATRTEVKIDVTKEAGSGLRHDSSVTCANFLTIDQRLIYKSIGRLSDPLMQQVDQCLRTALGL